MLLIIEGDPSAISDLIAGVAEGDGEVAFHKVFNPHDLAEDKWDEFLGEFIKRLLDGFDFLGVG